MIQLSIFLLIFANDVVSPHKNESITNNHRTMRKLLLLILTLFIANLAVMADRVSEAEALQKAQQFMQGKKFKMDGKRRAISPQQQQPAYYVFNAESDGGFVIVAGDDRMPDILGYSEKGNINMRNIPCNMEWLMNCYTQTLDSLNAYGITHKWSSRRSNNFATIEPLIMTTWGQHAPYNKYCPEIEGEKCPTGCVATAMAQIINYKKWPQGETTAVDAYTTHSGISMPALEPTTFDWSNMTDDDIARLMLYCGQAARMNYLLSGSGTGEPSEALKSVFGYSNSTKSWLIKIFESEHLIETVYNELADDRPVFYTGYSNTNNDGHAFVVDGYKDGMFHINWGWNGDADGYFDITGLTEDVMPFLPTWETEMVVGIEPPAPNSEQAKVIVSEFQSGYRNSYRTNASEDFLFPVSFHGLFSCDYNASCYIGLGFYHDNELVKVIASQLVSFPMDDFLYFNNVYIEKDIGQNEVKEGLWIPDYFIVEENGEYFVWAADSKEKLEKRKIEIGDKDEELGKYQIKNGLTIEDYIAIPNESLTEGIGVNKFDTAEIPVDMSETSEEFNVDDNNESTAEENNASAAEENAEV